MTGLNFIFPKLATKRSDKYLDDQKKRTKKPHKKSKKNKKSKHKEVDSESEEGMSAAFNWGYQLVWDNFFFSIFNRASSIACG